MADSSQDPLDSAAEAAAAAGGNQAETLPPATLPSAAGLSEVKVQNAVAFLSHPKVKSASVESKRSFLEGKGLNAAEIDEGFRRVPEAITGGVGAGAQTVPTKPFPVGGSATTLNALQPGQAAYPQQIVVHQPPPVPQPQPIRWTQVVVGAGALLAGAYAVKQYVIPFTSQAYERWAGKPLFGQSAAEKAAEARTAELIAKAIQAQTSELRSAVDSLKEMVKGLDRAPAPGLHSDTLSLSDLRSELRTFATSLSEFGSTGANTTSSSSSDVKALQEELRQLKAMVADSSHRPRQPPDSHAVQGGHGASRAGAQHKWGSSYGEQESPSSFNGDPGHASSNGGVGDARPGAPAVGAMPASTPSTPPPHPASYMEVLDMLERGETPPNVRKDINDKPPNPNLAPPAAKLKPRPKPWEIANGHVAQSGEPAAASTAQNGPIPRSPFKPGSVSYAASGSSFSGGPNGLPGSSGYPLPNSSSLPGSDGYPFEASGPVAHTTSSQSGLANHRTNGATSALVAEPVEGGDAPGGTASQAGTRPEASASAAPAKTGYLGALMKGRAEALSALRSGSSHQDAQGPDSAMVNESGSLSEAPKPWVPPAAPTPSLPTRRHSPKAGAGGPNAGTSDQPAVAAADGIQNGNVAAEGSLQKPEGSMYSNHEGDGSGSSEAKSMPHLTHEQEASSPNKVTNGISVSKSDVQSYSLEDSFHDGSFSDGASSPTHPLPAANQDAAADSQH
ncbi:hypothetical protein WJX74_006450 [Apatococcus lobatus]|uniref:Peroxisomal membrane protein PEX14 n=1 Tax=Apatococcus lobatus TaxID=904363 RepID=A0AAW1RW39_9CHLO